MSIRPLLSIALASTLFIVFLAPPKGGMAAGDGSDGPTYTADKQLVFPERYREWVYLGSGVDMSYEAKDAAPDHSMFNTVFVNPASYRAFMKTGTWPDGTALVLENRGAAHGGEHQASINKHGLTQTNELMGLEVHVKDASLAGGWGFYAFDNARSARIIGRSANCYSCHEQHAAVDTSFVQFYPTLLEVAKAKGTLSKAYVQEMAGSAK